MHLNLSHIIFSVRCKVGYTNCPSYDKVLWKVLNVGEEAERRGK